MIRCHRLCDTVGEFDVGDVHCQLIFAFETTPGFRGAQPRPFAVLSVDGQGRAGQGYYSRSEVFRWHRSSGRCPASSTPPIARGALCQQMVSP